MPPIARAPAKVIFHSQNGGFKGLTYFRATMRHLPSCHMGSHSTDVIDVTEKNIKTLVMSLCSSFKPINEANFANYSLITN